MMRLALLLFVLCLATPVQAQNVPVVLDDVAGWWNQFDRPVPGSEWSPCFRRLQAVQSVPDDLAPIFAGIESGSREENDHTREWCHSWDRLGENQRRGLLKAANRTTTSGAPTRKDGITRKAADRVFDVAGWWNGSSLSARQFAIGISLALGFPGRETVRGRLESDYADLIVAYAAAADAAYTGLQQTPTPAPALPLQTTLLLGLGLAAAGYARLRLRHPR